MTRAADSVGAVALLAVAFLPIGCLELRVSNIDLRPFIAVSGQYSLMGEDSPTPAPPAPAGQCEEGCKCNGTGKEKSGDGLAVIECRCPETCKCKNKSAEAEECTNGQCPPATRVIVR